MLDNLPEALYNALAPVPLRRAKDDVGATRERQQTRHHDGVDVKKRQSAKHRLARPDTLAKELSGVPRVGHLIAVSAHRNLWQSRGAARAEAGRNIIEGYPTRALKR